MQIGLISDTHDRMDKIERAVRFFKARKLDYIFHAGDFIAPFTAQLFLKMMIPMIGVFGNNDGEKKGLLQKYAPFAKIHIGPKEFELKGYKIALMHEPVDIEKYIAGNRVIIYGHTHKNEIRHLKDKLVVNPGECCGYLTGRSTVAVVDVKTLKVSITDI